MVRHFVVESCAEKAVRRRAEQSREEGSERREHVGGRWGILAENRTLVISPLAGFFVWQAFATAAIQVAVKMKVKYLCQCLSGCSCALDHRYDLHNLVLEDWLLVR